MLPQQRKTQLRFNFAKASPVPSPKITSSHLSFKENVMTPKRADSYINPRVDESSDSKQFQRTASTLQFFERSQTGKRKFFLTVVSRLPTVKSVSNIDWIKQKN